MNPYIEIKAKTVNEAVTKAMMELSAPSELLEYEVLEEGTSGFLGIGGKKACIRVRRKEEPDMTDEILGKKKGGKKPAGQKKASEKKPPVEKKPADKKPEKKQEAKNYDRFSNPDRVARPVTSAEPAEKPEAAPAAEPVAEAPARKEREVVPVDVTPCFPAAEEFLSSVFEAMDLKVDIDIKAGEEVNTIDIDLKGDDMGILIGKRGQTLDALQYLTSIVVNAEQNEYIRVKVDTENYRFRRKETLENLARNLESKVKRNGKAVILEPMNAYERRIIHSALQGSKIVTTHSEGEEPFRKVVVTPHKDFKPYPSGNRRRGNYRGGYRGNRGNGRGRSEGSNREA